MIQIVESLSGLEGDKAFHNGGIELFAALILEVMVNR
jgi:hypothetical protein